MALKRMQLVTMLGLLVLGALSIRARAESGPITTGNFHTCALTTAGALQCWGGNDGLLGDGTTAPRFTPGPVTGLSSGVQASVAGFGHTCALTTAGAVHCWGANTQGQLGDDTTERRLTPVPVTALSSGVQAIAAGDSHTCALTTAGAVQCWGSNLSGELGDGTATGRRTPVPVSGFSSGAQSIAAGSNHTCALTTAGAVQCWGSNNFGQLGDGTFLNRLTPMPVTGLSGGVRAITAGNSHTCAITTAGAAKCWGNGVSGQLGDGTATQRLTPAPVSGLTTGLQAIAAGSNHTCALTTAGAVHCWGANSVGEVGDGTTTQRLAPVPVTGLSSGVQAIAASCDCCGAYNCALTTAGAVQCWGANNGGQLGDGTNTQRRTPVPAIFPGAGDVTPGITLRGPATADADDLAGSSVAIGDDAANETIIIGAPGAQTRGEVYVYVRSSSSVSSTPDSAKSGLAESFAKNIAPAVVLPAPAGIISGDKFGQAVATSPNGSTIAVGAPQQPGGSGRVFVFRKPPGGWDSGPPAPPVEIPAPAPAGGVAPQDFGATLAYAADGTLIIGAPRSDVGPATAAGAAFAYNDNGATVVPISGGLTAGSPQTNARFGAAVAADDGLIAIGAPEENDGARTQQGAAYLFPVNSGSIGAGTRIRPALGEIGDKFGASVGVDNGSVVVGAPGDNTGAGENSGSARLFKPEAGGVYTETSILMPATGNDQGTGTAVAMRDGNILLGAPLATAFGKPAAGRAYLYKFEDGQSSSSEAADAILENQTGDTGDQFGLAVTIGRKRLGMGVPNDTEPDSAGALQESIGRTDTYILDGILRSGFE